MTDYARSRAQLPQVRGALAGDLGPIRDFHAKLQTWYEREPERSQYLEHPGVGHFLTPELNNESCHQMTAWFQRWLPAQ